MSWCEPWDGQRGALVAAAPSVPCSDPTESERQKGHGGWGVGEDSVKCAEDRLADPSDRAPKGGSSALK